MLSQFLSTREQKVLTGLGAAFMCFCIKGRCDGEGVTEVGAVGRTNAGVPGNC